MCHTTVNDGSTLDWESSQLLLLVFTLSCWVLQHTPLTNGPTKFNYMYSQPKVNNIAL